MAKKEVEDTKVKKRQTKKEKKVKKKDIPKKRETVLFANSDEEAQELLKQISSEEPTVETKEVKKSKFWSEVKAFFGIILFIGAFVGIGFLIYKFVEPLESKVKDNKEENKVVQTSDYKTVSYTAKEGNSLTVFGDKYLVEFGDGVVSKVLDMDTNVLFEGNEDYSYLYVGSDGELYLLFYEDINKLDSLKLYVFKNKELVEVKSFEEKGYNFTSLVYWDGNNEQLLGIVGEKYSYDSDDFSTNSKIYLLNGKEYETDKVRLTGDSVRLAVDEPIYTYNSKYVVAIDTVKDYKHGIFDLSKGEMIVNTKYDGLYTTESGNYIAVKNKKAGIVNIKSKILVDFKYDFISDEGEFYVIASNNKLGILDKNYKVVIEPKFTFQEDRNIGFSYQPCCGADNSFRAYKYDDKYILKVNEFELYEELNYKVHETYVIDESGEYLTIQENDFDIVEDFIYSYDKDKKLYTIFDEHFAEKYTIDLSSYDFENNPTLGYINESTISIHMDTTLYFDAITGEEIDEVRDTVFVDDKIEFKLNNESKTLKVKVDGKEISTIKNYERYDRSLFDKVDENTYYCASYKSYVMIRKSE